MKPKIPIPIENLHLETLAILLFLFMVARIELRRARSPHYDVLGDSPLLRLLPVFFLVMVVGLTRLLYGVSPLIGFELGAGITLALFHPANALCFMILLMTLRPWEIGFPDPILNMIPRFGAGLCAFSWALHSSKQAVLSPRSRRGIIFLLAFSAWLLLTTLKTPSIVASLASWFDVYFRSLTMFGLTILLVESELSVTELQNTLVISSLTLMATGIYRVMTIGLTDGRLMSPGTLGDPNDMGSLIVMAMPFALVPAFEKKSGPLGKLGGAAYAGIVGTVVWLTRSRGTMLAIAAQLLAVRLVKNPKKRLGLMLLAGFLGLGYVGLVKLVPRARDDMSASEDSRLTFWKSAVNMAAHNPLFGVGFYQFPDNYMSYSNGSIYRGNRTAHSTWFLALGESGLVGFFFFCAFFLTVVRVAWRARDQRPAQFYALVGYGVAMSFLSHTYSQYFYTLMALILASDGIAARAEKNAS